MMKKYWKRKLTSFCGNMGALIIGFVILTCIPMTLPKVFGYEIYGIISGSMEPALPIGSAIYVQKGSSVDIEDVVAFQVENEVVAHRIVEIDDVKKQVITKGDANAMNDRNPVSYDRIIGKVVFHIPYAGIIFTFFSTTSAKLLLFCLLGAGVLLLFISQGTHEKEESSQIAKKHTKQALFRGIIILGGVILILLIWVLGIIVKTMIRYKTEEQVDKTASMNYVTKDENKTGSDPYNCPIQVDFEQLQEINPEIIAWIYCEDTVIDYPVCRGEDDEYYLSHSYDKQPKISGSIFMETKNAADCQDANIILYGHHMKNKSMFATLSNWGKQDYYESHPYMWFITPQKTYRVDLFAGYVTDALSETYTVFQGYAPELAPYLNAALQQSEFETRLVSLQDDISSDNLENQQFIVLSTCDYSAENARYVLHGRLVEWIP